MSLIHIYFAVAVAMVTAHAGHYAQAVFLMVFAAVCSEIEYRKWRDGL